MAGRPPFSTSCTRPRTVPAAAPGGEASHVTTRTARAGRSSLLRKRRSLAHAIGPYNPAAMLSVLLLAAAIDGEAALRHASALAALGPHPWGSPRNRAAAEYVAVQFREAGLGEVRLQEFDTQGVAGANVIGVLRAAGPEVVVVGAHHDTAPDAPGAYDDGGGVGVLVELARAMGREPARTRTFVFASFDGEEAWSTGKATTTGSRAYVKSLGAEARNVVAAFVIEMCGWNGGTPVLHTIPYRDPRETGRSVVTPAWLVRASLSPGGFRLGDPLIPWL